MKKYIKIISIIFILILIIFLTFLYNAGKLLVVNETPRKSDVIIVLGGDSGERTEYSVKLYKEGYAKKIMFSGSQNEYEKSTEAFTMSRQAISLGVPWYNVILDNKANSTYQNALFTKELALKYGFKSAIVVTSNYHMRRSRLVYKKAFHGTGISLTYCSAVDKEYKPDKWWKDRYTTDIVISEYTKLIGYKFLNRW
jgi:uncharacterized SAM-binding protein YcdF (DUF218 family)